MWRSAGLVVVFGFAFGCGGSAPSPEASADVGQPAAAKGDPPAPPAGEPKPVPKEGLPAAKARLAKLEKDIEAKEKELTALKAEADLLRGQIAAAEGTNKVYRSPAELFADMPRDKYPSPSEDGAPERAVCNKWLKENVVGRVVEWKATVGGAEFFRGSKDSPEQTTAVVYLKQLAANNATGAGLLFEGGVSFGSEKAEVLMYRQIPDQENRFDDSSYPLLWYEGVGAEAAKRVRELKGREVTFRGAAIAADVGITPPYGVPLNICLLADPKADRKAVRTHKGLVIRLAVTPPTLDGFDPRAQQK
jgi:hypothetical protein